MDKTNSILPSYFANSTTSVDDIMIDYFLRFPDEATANAVLFTAVSAELDLDGNIVTPAYTTPNYVNVSTIGVHYHNISATEFEATPGWHVNVRADESSALVPYQITPATPSRVWA
jgi:hypothetical protein